MRETSSGEFAPRPFRLVRPKDSRQRLSRLVVSRAHQIGVTRIFLRQPVGGLVFDDAIESRIEVAPAIPAHEIWPKGGGENLRSEIESHLGHERRYCGFSVDSPVPFFECIQTDR